MTRILLVPNYSLTCSREGIEQDSYFSFLEKFLALMKENRNDIFWYVLIPKLRSKESILFSNIKKKIGSENFYFIKLDLPIYPQKSCSQACFLRGSGAFYIDIYQAFFPENLALFT